MTHIPVLLDEVIKFLDPKPGEIVLDATIDGGGHAMAIADCIAPGGILIGIDEDDQLLKEAKLKVKNARCEIILLNGNFRNLNRILKPLKINKLDAALFDLGMSSNQLEQSGRGFSFLRNEPLLMTYKYPLTADDLTAGEVVNSWSEKEIADIIFHYGEERYAKRIARNIVSRRREGALKTTFDLVDVIKASIPGDFKRRIHPATKTFQALRIAVNDELNALSDGLEKVWNFLTPGSRVVVISFHSLEDRIVKNFLRDKTKSGMAEIKTKKPVVPSDEEILRNPASRSAKLRSAVKTIN